MDDLVEFHLETFNLTSKESGSSLSVTSIGFISNFPACLRRDHVDIYQLVQSGDLWLLSPGFSQLEVTIIIDGEPVGEIGPETRFLEDIAESVCQCLAWKRLGLNIVLHDVQYEPPYGGAPNLYFNIQHPDKSAALLSPPYALTAHLKGLQSIFHFQTEDSDDAIVVTSRFRDVRPTHSEAGNDEEEQSDSGVFAQPLTNSPDLKGDPDDPCLGDDGELDVWNADSGTILSDLGEPHITEIKDQEMRDLAAHLVDTALYIMLGLPRQRKGLQLLKLDKFPSLIQLAPAVWNTHYLKAMCKHVKSFPIISEVLTRLATKAQTPALRKKTGELLEVHRPRDAGEDSLQSQQAVRQRLWRLMHAKLKHSVGTEKCPKDLPTSEPLEFADTETNLPPCIQELDPGTGAPLESFESGFPQSSVESPFTSDWPLPLHLADEYMEDTDNRPPFEAVYCHDEDVEGYLPDSYDNAWDTDNDHWVAYELDMEGSLDEGSDELPRCYFNEQPTQQFIASLNSCTPEVIEPEKVWIDDDPQCQETIERYNLMDHYMDGEFPTSETISREDDRGFLPPCHFDDADLDMDLDVDVREKDM